MVDEKRERCLIIRCFSLVFYMYLYVNYRYKYGRYLYNNEEGGRMPKATHALSYFIIILGYFIAGMLYMDQFFISMIMVAFSSIILMLSRKLERNARNY